MNWIKRLISKLNLSGPCETVADQIAISQASFSQCGEDRIMAFIADTLQINAVTYLDIGGYDPISLSNTYLFYRRGCHGVCVEPNPPKANAFKVTRPRDKLVQAGVGASSASAAKFYVMDQDYLCTFDAEEAQRMCTNEGHRVIAEIELPVLTISQIIKENCKLGGPDLVTIDVEGLDLDILKSFDFSLQRPAIFCVETLTYSMKGEGVKNHEIISLMESNGYFHYADTYINSIFVDTNRWLAALQK